LYFVVLLLLLPSRCTFQGISKQQATTLVEALYNEGLIKDPIVSYKIPRLADGKNDGEMTLGAMNPAKFDTESVVTVPNVNDRGFWEGAVDGVVVNGTDMGWTNRTAIFDTGTVRFFPLQHRMPAD
jgi:hypothetical protein